MEPATLGEAIALQPQWLMIWLAVLAGTNLAAVLFIIGRTKDTAGQGRWFIRPEAIAILAAFFAAGSLMEYLYQHYGYVRLLGLAHLVFWVPVYAWIALKRRYLHPMRSTLFGKYLLLYFVVSGASLIIDAVDVVRYFAGF